MVSSIFLLIISLFCLHKCRNSDKKLLSRICIISLLFCTIEIILMIFSLKYSPLVKYPVTYILIISICIIYVYKYQKALWIKIIISYLLVIFTIFYYYLTPAVVISKDYIGVYDKVTGIINTNIEYYKNYYLFVGLKYSYIEDYGVLFGDWRDVTNNIPYSVTYNDK